jgi:CBS domain-containing protein
VLPAYIFERSTQALTGLGRETGDVHEPGDVTRAGSDVGDDRAAVGVTHEHDGPVDRADDIADGGRVAREAPQGIGDGDHAMTRVPQRVDDAIPAGGLGERAVDEQDRWFHATTDRTAPGSVTGRCFRRWSETRPGSGSGVPERVSAVSHPSRRILMAKTARDVMTGGAECIAEDETVLDAAKRLAELDVGAMPICGDDNRLKGMLSDRDIVVKVLAQGKDPASTKAGELGEGKPVTIGADDSVSEALHTMKEHKVRRLPVIDGHDLPGIVSQADLARNVDEEEVGDLVEAISSAP